jgi:hypothetical protein
LAYIQVVKAKTQIVTDAAARAAGRAYAETDSQAQALAAAQEMASLNPIDSLVVPIQAGDLEFGVSERRTQNKAYTFVAAPQGNAVRVQTRSFSDGFGNALEPFFPTFGSDFEIRPLCVATNTQTTLDVVLVLDRSGSMAYAANETSGSGTPPASAPPGWVTGDPAPPNSRWLDLVAAVDAFCDEMATTAKTEQIGLASYSSLASRDVELTGDYTQIHNRCEDISQSEVGGATNIGDGILFGLDAVTDPRFARPWATNAVVVLSDGNHNTGTDPIVAASEAVDRGVPVYSVSFSDEADQDLMQDIADMTGGSHYHAVTATELADAFRDIARRLPSMLTE